MPPSSWITIDVTRQTVVLAFLGSVATNSPHRLRWELLSAKILYFGVKAGIGLLNNPRKHHTGKACTLVKQQLALLIFD